MDKNQKKRMKFEWVLGGLGWFMLIVILLLLVFTVLNLNRIISWPVFDTYLPLSLSIFFGLFQFVCQANT